YGYCRPRLPVSDDSLTACGSKCCLPKGWRAALPMPDDVPCNQDCLSSLASVPLCNFGSVAASCGSRVTRMLLPQRVPGESLFGMVQKGSSSDFEAIVWSVSEFQHGHAYGPEFGGINAVVVFVTSRPVRSLGGVKGFP